MLGLIVFVLSFVFILIAWGFWVALAAFLGAIALPIITKPRFSWEINWGSVIVLVVIDILGICAVNSIWHEPVYNVVAVVLVILSYVV